MVCKIPNAAISATPHSRLRRNVGRRRKPIVIVEIFAVRFDNRFKPPTLLEGRYQAVESIRHWKLKKTGAPLVYQRLLHRNGTTRDRAVAFGYGITREDALEMLRFRLYETREKLEKWMAKLTARIDLLREEVTKEGSTRPPSGGPPP